MPTSDDIDDKPRSKATAPCPDCGRTLHSHLASREAVDRFGHHAGTCPICLLSRFRRRPSDG